jgi:S1-C subfamily serine protease
MAWFAIACPPVAQAEAADAGPLTVVEAATGRLLGSATAIGGTRVLTNRHVIELAQRRGADVALARSGRVIAARVSGVSLRLDMALLVAAEPPRLSAQPPVGAPVQARGPAGPTVEGVVIAYPWREAWGPALFARLPAGFGFSGGPVTDASGAVIGLVTAAVNPTASEMVALRAGRTALPGRDTPVVLVLPIGSALAEAERLAAPGHTWR